jgi:transcriptional repressor NrdR
MQCPSCQHTDSRVLESRSADSGRSVRRRRECLHCEFRFTTYERVETVPITVVKRNGSREAFNRSKLLHGLLRACEKTGLELVLQQLAGMSDVAYVRFASVYRQFQSISDFVATLEGLSRQPRSKRLAAVG